MNKTEIAERVLQFHCPRYDELPDMNLYLEQVISFVNAALLPIGPESPTGAMLSNYVKNGVIPTPNRKKYNREHLAYIIVTTLIKQVFSLQQIARFFEIQRSTYSLETAYNFFCSEFENALNQTFCFTGEAMPRIETKLTDQTVLVRAIVLAAANRVYAEKLYFND